jgi:hypothetical protein
VRKHYSKNSIISNINHHLSSRVPSFVFLYSLFCLAFYFSPYWILPKTEIQRTTLLAITLIVGCFWAYYSAGIIKFSFKKKDYFQFILLFLTILIINYLPINSQIPWRGDEARHIQKTLTLMEKIDPIWIVGGFLLIFISIFMVLKKPKFGFWFWAASLLILMLVFFKDRPLSNTGSYYLLRYPYINYLLISFFPSLLSLVKLQYLESIYRIIPFFSTVGLVWIFSKDLQNKNMLIGWLWGVTIATIPLTFYYSSILYLEMPAVMLMGIALIKMDFLLFEDSTSIKNNVGWIALLIIPFIKETTIVFLLCFLLFRWFFSFRIFQKSIFQKINLPIYFPNAHPRNKWQKLFGELKIAFSVIFPWLFFMVLRSNFASISRQYFFTPSNLLKISTYIALSKSFFDQFGILILVFIVSILFLFRKNKAYLAIMYLGFILINILFYTLDDRKYIGYSRFNLYLLPLFLVAINHLLENNINKKAASSLLIGALLVTNLLLSPILKDGNKKPFWGEYNFNTSEHYYPYYDVLKYLRDTKPDSAIFIADAWRQYYIQFYLSKLNWSPKYEFMVKNIDSNLIVPKEDDWNQLDLIISSAKDKGYDAVIYHVLGSNIPKLKNQIYSYEHKIFCNMAHCLILFYK